MIGALLAGGAGRRMAALAAAPGVSAPAPVKPAVPLGGRPLAAWPLDALAAVCDRIGVVVKPETALPPLPGTERWEEPDEPLHPLTGILHALERSRAAVLVCAADMPFVTPDALRSILNAAGGTARPAAAAVAVSAGVLQPVLGVYAPAAADVLRRAPVGAPLTAMVEQLDPVRVALPERLTRSVNTPEDLAAAEHELAGGPPPS